MKRKLLILVLPFFLVVLFVSLIIGLFFSDDSSGDTSNFIPQSEAEKVALQVYNFVLENGGTKEFAAAWIGNMEHESGLIPARIQSDLGFNQTWAFDSSVGGYALGLAQWDSDRRVNMLNEAKNQNKDWKTVEYQLDFAWNHDGSDSSLLKKMSTQTDLNQTAIDILVKWERAGTKNDPLQQEARKISANNWYNRLAKGSAGAGSANIGGGKIDILEAKLGQQVYNGQCYGLTSFYVDSFNTAVHLGAGSPYDIAEQIGNTVHASEIGSAYAWEKNGWTVIFNPSYSEIKAGDIINYGQGGDATSEFGHTGIIASVDGNNKFTTYEQNSGQGQICAKYSLTWGQQFPVVTSIVRKN